ncbi:site-specific integrase [Actinomadura opuntiae]|uniref:site-specific integrase n=1 Tax=Actinomadura sp. OS1-43 TaxID=604315 RepID=UPI00255AD5C8|nr:site-specific integrase [Actinomadura sp. OS1-43]MDL4813049.1 tyrosine-type recombinase/integrase [Actinomadura sp. OS1-43]
MAKILIGRYEGTIYREGDGFTGAISLGFGPDGVRKRVKRKARNKGEVKRKLIEAVADLDKGVKTEGKYTVAQCVNDFLAHGLKGRSENTLKVYNSIAKNHVIPKIGRIKLKELNADHVEEMLRVIAETKSTETVRRTHNLLTRSIRMAERRDRVGRNVAALVDPPEGCVGRQSKSLSLEQAAKLVVTAQDPKWRLGAYVILSLMSGIRTEEARTLRWADVDLDKGTVYVLRADRHRGGTKTRKSRRGLSIAQVAIAALAAHKARQASERLAMGQAWRENDLLFCHRDGSALDANQVRSEFQKITKAAGLGDHWVPRELRHTFVSLLSDHDVPVERIADLVGHSDTRTTETVYRHRLKPVIKGGAEIMDAIFNTGFETPGGKSA